MMQRHRLWQPRGRHQSIRLATYIAAMLALVALGIMSVLPAARAVLRQPIPADDLPRTTDGAIALGNLQGQIDVLQRKHALTVAERAALAELLSARGQYTGRIADRERALELTEALAREQPDDAVALLARARGRAAFHRFAEALSDLDAAAVHGGSPMAIDGIRAGILQALGRYDEALAIRREKAARYPTADTLGALATLQAERGETDAAARLFVESRRAYRDVSPFPLAWSLFDEGLMAMRHGNLARARELFLDAHRRLPSFAAARCHLAEVEAALGNAADAVTLLEPLARTADDPDPAAQLARIYSQMGRTGPAAQWRAVAARRYEELLARYPEAYADHGAEFFLGTGGHAKRALALAQQNLTLRQTPRAYELVLAAAFASGDTAAACAVQAEAAAAQDHSPALSELLQRARVHCGLS